MEATALVRRLLAILRSTLRALASGLFALLVILLMAGLPLLISEKTGSLVLDPGKVLGAIEGFLRNVADGSVLEYRIGYTTWDFREIGPKFLLVSFQYTALPGALGLALGAFAGVLRGTKLARAQARREAARLGGESAEAAGGDSARPPRGGALVRALRGASRRASDADPLPELVLGTPDFLLILLAKILVPALLGTIGLRLALAGRDGTLAPLPVLVMAVYPYFLARRAATEEARRAEGEDYVRFARAKGLPESLIAKRHVGAAVIPRLEAELPRLIAFMQGSLFICEIAFALPGMARFLYNSAFAGARSIVLRSVYQYDFVVIALVGTALSCVATWALLRLSLALARKGLTHE